VRRAQLGVVELADLLVAASGPIPLVGRHRELEARRRRPRVLPPPLLLHGGGKIFAASDSSPVEMEPSGTDTDDFVKQ
jgi:hypothetical protein